jgi:predicted nucleic acid-binding protein
MAEVVADASALVDLLLDDEPGQAVRRRLAGQVLHAPAHVDAEALPALGRLHRDGQLEVDDVESRLVSLTGAPLVRHPRGRSRAGRLARRHQLRPADACYVELATTRGWPLVTTDRRLRSIPAADVVGP